MSEPTQYPPNEPEPADGRTDEARRQVDEAMAVHSLDDTGSRNPDQNAGEQEARDPQPGEQDVPEEIRRLRERE